MDNFIAAYFSVGLGIVFLAMGFWFKKIPLFLIAGLAWMIVVFYCLSIYTTSAELYVLGLAVLSFTAAIASFILPYTLIVPAEKKAPRNDAEQMQDEYQAYNDELTSYRNLRNMGKKKR